MGGGETYEAALLRELREETGLALDPALLAPAVWTRDCLFTWEGRVERHLERFFLVRISTREAHPVVIDTDTAGRPRDHRWWTLDAIRSTSERFAPTRLAEHLAVLLDGQIPREPVEVGE